MSQSPPSFGRAVAPLSLLTLAMMLGFTMMGSFGTVQESVKLELGLSDQALSVIQGVSAAVALVIFSVPIGVLVDRFNRVRLLVALGALWTIGTLLTALAHGAVLLFVARMLTAIGTTGALTAALSLTADLCVPEQRGRALLIVNVGKTAGIAAAFALAGWLFGWFTRSPTLPLIGATAPWRATHAALAVVSVALVLPLLLLREPARREVAAGTHAPFSEVMRELWGLRAFLIPLFVGQLSVVMADNAALLWSVPVLSRNFGLQPDAIAGWMGILIFASGLGGTILGGFAADWGQRRRRRGGLLIGAVVAAAAGIPGAFFPIMPGVPGFAAALGLLTLCGAITGLVASVALTVMIPNELRGLCIGLFITVAGLIGFGIAPWLVTVISGLLGGERHLAAGLTVVGVAVSVIAVFAFLLAMRRAPAPPVA